MPNASRRSPKAMVGPSVLRGVLTRRGNLLRADGTEIALTLYRRHPMTGARMIEATYAGETYRGGMEPDDAAIDVMLMIERIA